MAVVRQQAVVEVYGEKLVAAELMGVGERASSLEPLWPSIFKYLEEVEREQFDSQGARSGHEWDELARATLLRKFRKGENLAIMRATDALYMSLTGTTSHSVRTYGLDWAVFGSTTPEFAFHQDRNPNADYPERLPVDLTGEDAFVISEMMLGYIMGTVDKNGRVLPPRGPGGRFVKR